MYRNYIEELNIKPDQVLVYLRKSRADDPLLTVQEVLAKHETILDEWADRILSGRIPEENRFREVVSGETISDRPEIQKILRLIESPRIKAILTVEVQRLSRGDLEDAGRLIKLLRYTNTLVITPQKTYDLSDEYDRDAFERELKRGNEFLEYQKKIMGRGRLLSVSQGNYIGSVPPYGYDKIWVMEGKRKCPTLAINEEQAAVVRMIFDLYVHQNMGITNICHYLDSLGIKPPKGEHWSYYATKDTLDNVHYIGKVKWNWRKTVKVVENSEIVEMRPKAKDGDYLTYDGKHEAIITEELFYAAREKRGAGPRIKKTTKMRNVLAGLVYCQCGYAMTLRTFKNSEGGEKCAARLLCDNQIYCHTGSCLYDEMLTLVKEALRKAIWNINVEMNGSQADSAKIQAKLIETLEKKLEDIEARELAQWEAQANPDPSQRMPADIFKRLNEKLQAEKQEVRAAIRSAKETMPVYEEYQERLVRFQTALDALNDPRADIEEKNRLLKDCIEKIVYKREKPQRLLKAPKGKVNPLIRSSGASWTNPPIELDIRLKIKSKT